MLDEEKEIKIEINTGNNAKCFQFGEGHGTWCRRIFNSSSEGSQMTYFLQTKQTLKKKKTNISLQHYRNRNFVKLVY